MYRHCLRSRAAFLHERFSLWPLSIPPGAAGRPQRWRLAAAALQLRGRALPQLPSAAAGDRQMRELPGQQSSSHCHCPFL